MGERARGYSWRRFEPGDEVRLTHGAYTEKRIAPLADEVEGKLVKAAPWTGRDAFAPARRRYARAEAVAELLWRYVVEHGPLDAKGEPIPALDRLRQWETAGANRAAALGLDPASFAKLLASFAAAPGADEVLEGLRADGAQVLAQHARRALDAPSVDGDERTRTETHE